MNLIPQVKEINISHGLFNLFGVKDIFIQNNSTDLFHSASILRKRIYFLTGVDIPIRVTQIFGDAGIFLKSGEEQSEEYRIKVDSERIILEGASSSALFWAVQTLLQIITIEGSIIPCLDIHDYPDFRHRGFFHDVTRGKVPKISTLKTLIEKLAAYKINELQLYIEHSFAFKCIPELWTGKDPLTSEDILELDHYSRLFHIDLIPSLASFGHLYELLRLKRFEHLNELNVNASLLPHNLWDRMAHYTIDPSNNESFELIQSMIDEYLPLFSSKFFNICCDETFDLGKGKNRDRADNGGIGLVYLDFVKKLIALVKRHGKIPMLWGDIVLNHPELIRELPADVVFLNWGYNADVKDDSTRIFSEANVRQYVCPGTQGWSRFAYDIESASSNIRKMVEYGYKYKAEGVLNTDWGDCGHVNPFSGLLHGMILGGSLSWNSESYGTNSSFDHAVSILEWGDKSGNLYRLLRDLGSLCFYHFGNIYAWVSGIEGLWNKEEKVKELEDAVVIKNYNRAIEIHQELIEMRSSNLDKILEYDELVLSSSAVIWTLGLLIFKKQNEYKQDSRLNIDKNMLISLGYRNLNEFIRIWRIRNRESELQNVICIYRTALEKIQAL